MQQWAYEVIRLCVVVGTEFATTRTELNYVFDIIDNTHTGEVTYKQFISVLHFDRPSKVY